MGNGKAMDSPWPISVDDVRDAAKRIRRYVPYPTPLRQYPALDELVGHGIEVLVKHENHQPTNSFKIRNGLAAMTALTDGQRGRGVVAATRGNHGQGVALAGRWLGVAVTICVPVGNNPEKNDAMRGFGAEVIEVGRDYDEALAVMQALARERGLTEAHSTNNPNVLAGAGTITLEMVEQAESLDAMVIAVGGGSQAVGAMTVLRALRPRAAVYAVQAEGAPAIYQSWKAGRPVTTNAADTFADGIATRSSYAMTFPALRDGLAGFVTVSDAEIAEAMRTLIRTTHNLVEPAAAAGLAGLRELAAELEGRRVGIILTGANVDQATLRAVVSGSM
jgi:threonine dehydratase